MDFILQTARLNEEPISQVFNCDCMAFMRSVPDKFFKLAIVDPEYGRGEDGGVNRSGLVKQKNGSKIFVKNGNHYKKRNWDIKPASPEYFEELFRVSEHQIIWGTNYYHKNFGPGRIVWDKVNDGSDQSDCEIAYNSLTKRVDLFRFMWRGMMQGKNTLEGHIMQGNKRLNEVRIHPTQKPIPLYRWTINKYAKLGDNIFDSHMGSQSHRIAAYDMGFDFYGCEIDAGYFYDGCNRFADYKSRIQPKLFHP